MACKCQHLVNVVSLNRELHIEPPLLQHTTLCGTGPRLQAWYVARRRKDKKKLDATPGPSEAGTGADAGGAASDAGGAEEVSGPAGATAAADAAHAELLEQAKAHLPVPFREDGPNLVSSRREQSEQRRGSAAAAAQQPKEQQHNGRPVVSISS
jgi:hypothetical protein